MDTSKRTLIISCIALLTLMVPRLASSQTAEQKAAANTFIDALVNRQWDVLESLEHPLMRDKITIDEWKKLLPGLEERAGAFLRHSFFSAEANGSYANIVHHAVFEKDSIGFRVVVDSMNFIGGFWLDPIARTYTFDPPPYADTTRFHEETVSVGDSLPLPGVLTIPDGDGPFPAVVLVHGSGPQDMDETIQGNKPFRDLAWGLASKGVMVLRYVKRTKKYGSKMNAFKVTVEDETIEDAFAAVRLLREQPLVDTSRIALAGHSLGGMVAPEIAYRDPSVKGIAMLGAIVRPLEVVIGEQLQFIAKSQDTLSVKEAMKLQHELDRIDQLQRRLLKPNQFFMNTPASYYYDLQERLPMTFLHELSIPVFIARGTKDYQSPATDFQILKDSLSGRPEVTFREYENCFHLFIPVDARPGPWNYEVVGHVLPALIDDLAAWIKSL